MPAEAMRKKLGPNFEVAYEMVLRAARKRKVKWERDTSPVDTFKLPSPTDAGFKNSYKAAFLTKRQKGG